MNLKILCLIVAPVVLLSNEPSAYGAGDLNSANPYGLTSSEQHILKNKQEVKSLEKKVGGVDMKLSEVSESYEGLRSITEGINQKIFELDKKISTLETNSSTSIQELRDELATLKTYVNESREIQTKNQENVKVVLTEMSSLIDSINTNYVSKKEYSSLASRVEEIENSLQKQTTVSQQSSGLSGAELLESATNDFDKKSYASAKAKFIELVEKKYKPARSSYYLAEIYYIEKSYAKAIENYKMSLSLYDKASYIPRLLYHTGISFSKLGKQAEANKFFDALKSGYPQSEEAKTLQK